MATLESSIYNYLMEQSAIVRYVGSRIYWIDTDQDETQDYIRYNIIVPQNIPQSFGDLTSSEPTLQFDVFSTDKGRALAICDLLITALHGFDGALGIGGNTITISTARGPRVVRDGSLSEWDGWYHGIVEADCEYTR